MKLKKVSKEQLPESAKKELDELVQRMPKTVHIVPTVAFIPPHYLVDVTQKPEK
jgi:hypothetical protein